jgi:hypothetical protein
MQIGIDVSRQLFLPRPQVSRSARWSACTIYSRAFQDVSPEEQRQMEEVLKRIGRRAEELGEQEGHC